MTKLKNINKDSDKDKSVEYLKAADEAKDNTRIVRYIFILVGAFLSALFVERYADFDNENSEALLSSELIHFIAGSLFTSVGVIIDRYFKSGTQKESEKDLTYLVGKLKQQETENPQDPHNLQQGDQ